MELLFGANIFAAYHYTCVYLIQLVTFTFIQFGQTLLMVHSNCIRCKFIFIGTLSAKQTKFTFILLDNNNIDNINLIISNLNLIINLIITIIAQIDGIYEISMMIDIINGILMCELNTQMRNGYICNSNHQVLKIVVNRQVNWVNGMINELIGLQENFFVIIYIMHADMNDKLVY